MSNPDIILLAILAKLVGKLFKSIKFVISTKKCAFYKNLEKNKKNHIPIQSRILDIGKSLHGTVFEIQYVSYAVIEKDESLLSHVLQMHVGCPQTTFGS